MTLFGSMIHTCILSKRNKTKKFNNNIFSKFCLYRIFLFKFKNKIIRFLLTKHFLENKSLLLSSLWRSSTLVFVYLYCRKIFILWVCFQQTAAVYQWKACLSYVLFFYVFLKRKICYFWNADMRDKQNQIRTRAPLLKRSLFSYNITENTYFVHMYLHEIDY